MEEVASSIRRLGIDNRDVLVLGTICAQASIYSEGAIILGSQILLHAVLYGVEPVGQDRLACDHPET